MVEILYAIKVGDSYFDNLELDPNKPAHFSKQINVYTALFRDKVQAAHYIYSFPFWFKDLDYDFVKVKKETIIKYEEL